MPWKPEEMFEVIGGKGEVIGQKPRGEVHKLGLRHKGVYLIIQDEQGRIFLQQRAKDKDLMPSVWDLSVAEHLKPKESYRDACVRGVEEELGIKVRNLKFLGEIDFYFKYPGGEIDNELNQIFAGEGIGEIKFQDGEVQAGKFVLVKELLKEMDEKPEKFTPWMISCKKFVEMLTL